MRIAIVGAGGVGGYFGARLAAAGADVSFVARGAHLEALQTRGLTLESPRGHLHLPHVNATDDPATIGQVDVAFFTVKLYDAEAAALRLAPLLGQGTVVIPFQNGVDSVDILSRAIGSSHVAGGTAYVSAVIAEPGVIRHTALDQLVFGEQSGERTPRMQRLLDACQPAGFGATLSDCIDVDIWTKFVRLTVFSGMTAAARSPIGVVRADPGLRKMMDAAYAEALAVARAKGVPLPEDVAGRMIRVAGNLPPHAKSSMLEDLERGRPLELPWLSGAIVRIGAELGVATPIHEFIATILGPHVRGANPVSDLSSPTRTTPAAAR